MTNPRHAVRYDTTTGEIMSYTTLAQPTQIPETYPPEFVDTFDFMNVGPGQAKMLLMGLEIPPSDSLFYVDLTLEPTLRPKADLDATNSLNGAVGWSANGEAELTYGPALPSGTVVTVECNNRAFGPAQIYTVDDGTLEFTTHLPGTYTLTLEAFPFLDKVIIVEAQP